MLHEQSCQFSNISDILDIFQLLINFIYFFIIKIVNGLSFKSTQIFNSIILIENFLLLKVKAKKAKSFQKVNSDFEGWNQK